MKRQHDCNRCERMTEQSLTRETSKKEKGELIVVYSTVCSECGNKDFFELTFKEWKKLCDNPNAKVFLR